MKNINAFIDKNHVARDLMYKANTVNSTTPVSQPTLLTPDPLAYCECFFLE